MKTNYKPIWIATLILAASALLVSQNTGTPTTLRVLTDANGYLVTAMAAQTAPLTQSTFSNTRLKTDSSGYLLTTGTISPTNFGNQNAYTYLGNATGSSATPTFTNSPILLANGVTSGNILKPSGRMYWENTNAVTTAMSVVPVFGTAFSIKGGTLGTNGDRVYVRASVTLGTAATDNKNLNCNIGYSSFNTSTGAFTGGLSIVAESSTANLGTLSWWVEAIVTRTAATGTSYEWQSKWGSSTTTQGANYTTDTGGITWANDNNFLCTVFNTTAMNTETMRLNQYGLYWEPYHP